MPKTRKPRKPPAPLDLPGVLKVDIHDMNAADAKKYLERLLVSCGSEVRQLEIIHGYHRGSVLLEVVRTEVRSKRIARRCVTMNPGVTIYYLKEKV